MKSPHATQLKSCLKKSKYYREPKVSSTLSVDSGLACWKETLEELWSLLEEYTGPADRDKKRPISIESKFSGRSRDDKSEGILKSSASYSQRLALRPASGSETRQRRSVTWTPSIDSVHSSAEERESVDDASLYSDATYDDSESLGSQSRELEAEAFVRKDEDFDAYEPYEPYPNDSRSISSELSITNILSQQSSAAFSAAHSEDQVEYVSKSTGPLTIEKERIPQLTTTHSADPTEGLNSSASTPRHSNSERDIARNKSPISNNGAFSPRDRKTAAKAVGLKQNRRERNLPEGSSKQVISVSRKQKGEEKAPEVVSKPVVSVTRKQKVEEKTKPVETITVRSPSPDKSSHFRGTSPDRSTHKRSPSPEKSSHPPRKDGKTGSSAIANAKKGAADDQHKFEGKNSPKKICSSFEKGKVKKIDAKQQVVVRPNTLVRESMHGNKKMVVRKISLKS